MTKIILVLLTVFAFQSFADHGSEERPTVDPTPPTPLTSPMAEYVLGSSVSDRIAYLQSMTRQPRNPMEGLNFLRSLSWASYRGLMGSLTELRGQRPSSVSTGNWNIYFNNLEIRIKEMDGHGLYWAQWLNAVLDSESEENTLTAAEEGDLLRLVSGRIALLKFLRQLPANYLESGHTLSEIAQQLPELESVHRKLLARRGISPVTTVVESPSVADVVAVFRSNPQQFGALMRSRAGRLEALGQQIRNQISTESNSAEKKLLVDTYIALSRAQITAENGLPSQTPGTSPNLSGVEIAFIQSHPYLSMHGLTRIASRIPDEHLSDFRSRLGGDTTAPFDAEQDTWGDQRRDVWNMLGTVRSNRETFRDAIADLMAIPNRNHAQETQLARYRENLAEVSPVEQVVRPTSTAEWMALYQRDPGAFWDQLGTDGDVTGQILSHINSQMGILDSSENHNERLMLRSLYWALRRRNLQFTLPAPEAYHATLRELGPGPLDYRWGLHPEDLQQAQMVAFTDEEIAFLLQWGELTEAQRSRWLLTLPYFALLDFQHRLEGEDYAPPGVDSREWTNSIRGAIAEVRNILGNPRLHSQLFLSALNDEAHSQYFQSGEPPILRRHLLRTRRQTVTQQLAMAQAELINRPSDENNRQTVAQLQSEFSKLNELLEMSVVSSSTPHGWNEFIPLYNQNPVAAVNAVHALGPQERIALARDLIGRHGANIGHFRDAVMALIPEESRPTSPHNPTEVSHQLESLVASREQGSRQAYDNGGVTVFQKARAAALTLDSSMGQLEVLHSRIGQVTAHHRLRLRNGYSIVPLDLYEDTPAGRLSMMEWIVGLSNWELRDILRSNLVTASNTSQFPEDRFRQMVEDELDVRTSGERFILPSDLHTVAGLRRFVDSVAAEDVPEVLQQLLRESARLRNVTRHFGGNLDEASRPIELARLALMLKAGEVNAEDQRLVMDLWGVSTDEMREHIDGIDPAQLAGTMARLEAVREAIARHVDISDGDVDFDGRYDAAVGQMTFLTGIGTDPAHMGPLCIRCDAQGNATCATSEVHGRMVSKLGVFMRCPASVAQNPSLCEGAARGADSFVNSRPGTGCGKYAMLNPVCVRCDGRSNRPKCAIPQTRNAQFVSLPAATATDQWTEANCSTVTSAGACPTDGEVHEGWSNTSVDGCTADNYVGLGEHARAADDRLAAMNACFRGYRQCIDECTPQHWYSLLTAARAEGCMGNCDRRYPDCQSNAGQAVHDSLHVTQRIAATIWRTGAALPGNMYDCVATFLRGTGEAIRYTATGEYDFDAVSDEDFERAQAACLQTAQAAGMMAVASTGVGGALLVTTVSGGAVVYTRGQCLQACDQNPPNETERNRCRTACNEDAIGQGIAIAASWAPLGARALTPRTSVLAQPVSGFLPTSIQRGLPSTTPTLRTPWRTLSFENPMGLPSLVPRTGTPSTPIVTPETPVAPTTTSAEPVVPRSLYERLMAEPVLDQYVPPDYIPGISELPAPVGPVNRLPLEFQGPVPPVSRIAHLMPRGTGLTEPVAPHTFGTGSPGTSTGTVTGTGTGTATLARPQPVVVASMEPVPTTTTAPATTAAPATAPALVTAPATQPTAVPILGVTGGLPPTGEPPGDEPPHEGPEGDEGDEPVQLTPSNGLVEPRHYNGVTRALKELFGEAPSTNGIKKKPEVQQGIADAVADRINSGELVRLGRYDNHGNEQIWYVHRADYAAYRANPANLPRHVFIVNLRGQLVGAWKGDYSAFVNRHLNFRLGD